MIVGGEQTGEDGVLLDYRHEISRGDLRLGVGRRLFRTTRYDWNGGEKDKSTAPTASPAS